MAKIMAQGDARFDYTYEGTKDAGNTHTLVLREGQYTFYINGVKNMSVPLVGGRWCVLHEALDMLKHKISYDDFQNAYARIELAFARCTLD